MKFSLIHASSSVEFVMWDYELALLQNEASMIVALVKQCRA
jgi:hypothetical protein